MDWMCNTTTKIPLQEENYTGKLLAANQRRNFTKYFVERLVPGIYDSDRTKQTLQRGYHIGEIRMKWECVEECN